MKFLLNNTICEEHDLAPDLTLLSYLREYKSLTGTKEGCASGDCGACTVLIGGLSQNNLLTNESPADALSYHSVNACITPLHAIAGKQVVTVEHLSKNNELHPSQQALIEHHGSQCGFCTPGFVMSLTALYEDAVHKGKNIDRSEVCEAISGNLCRCTGYRPIVNAGLNMDVQQPSVITHERKATIDALHTISDESTYHAKQYFKPTSELELQTLIGNNRDAKLIAGGTDLMLDVTQRYHRFNTLIDITGIPHMRRISSEGENLCIGAAVTYHDLARFFEKKHQRLHALFERIASCQIRNRGTIGGNIANASPIADLAPILLALDSRVIIKNSAGHVRSVRLCDFYHTYKTTDMDVDEYIACFELPNAFLEKHVDLYHHCDFYKVSKRVEDDISSVMLAARFVIKNGIILEARIAYGGMAPIPVRVTLAENSLQGKAIDNESALDNAIGNIESTLSPISDVRASASYRLKIAANLLRKSWMSAQGKVVPLLTQNTHISTQGATPHA